MITIPKKSMMQKKMFQLPDKHFLQRGEIPFIIHSKLTGCTKPYFNIITINNDEEHPFVCIQLQPLSLPVRLA